MKTTTKVNKKESNSNSSKTLDSPILPKKLKKEKDLVPKQSDKTKNQEQLLEPISFKNETKEVVIKNIKSKSNKKQEKEKQVTMQPTMEPTMEVVDVEKTKKTKHTKPKEQIVKMEEMTTEVKSDMQKIKKSKTNEKEKEMKPSSSTKEKSSSETTSKATLKKSTKKTLKKSKDKPTTSGRKNNIAAEIDYYLNIVTRKLANEAIILRTSMPTIKLYKSNYFPNMKIIESSCSSYLTDKVSKLIIEDINWEPPSDFSEMTDINEIEDEEERKLYIPPEPKLTCLIYPTDLPPSSISDFHDDIETMNNNRHGKNNNQIKEYKLKVKFELIERKSSKIKLDVEEEEEEQKKNKALEKPVERSLEASLEKLMEKPMEKPKIQKTSEEKLMNQFTQRLKTLFEHKRIIPFPHQNEFLSFFDQKCKHLFESGCSNTNSNKNNQKNIQEQKKEHNNKITLLNPVNKMKNNVNNNSNKTNKTKMNTQSGQKTNIRNNQKKKKQKDDDTNEDDEDDDETENEGDNEHGNENDNDKEEEEEQKEEEQTKSDGMALFLYWKMGLGKSYGALLPFSKYHVSQVYILCTNAMIEPWMKFLTSLSQPKGSTTRFHIIGLTEFSKMVNDDHRFLLNQYVIFDEAHMFRSLTPQMKEEIAALQKSKLLLNLSGTPLMNDPEDLIGVAGVMMYHLSNEEKLILKRKDYKKSPDLLIKYLEIVNRIFHGKVHYVIPDNIVKEECAPIIEELREVEMTWKQTIDYLRGIRANFILGGLHLQSSCQGSFRSNQKKFSNMSKHDNEAPKFDRVIKDVMDYIDCKKQEYHQKEKSNQKENKDHENKFQLPQQIIYSNFLDNGINSIYKRLKNLKYKIALTTGKNTKERDSLFEQYNNRQFNILAMSRIANSGLTFHNTDLMYIIDSFDNDASKRQLMYRISRIGANEKQEDGTFKPIHVVTYISKFPKTYQPEEASLLLQYFVDNYWTNASQEHIIDCLGTPEHFMNLLLEKLKIEENNMTVDEKMIQECKLKTEILQPMLDHIANLGLQR